jgi:pimeloyl-ACP methyl ester carboxylesterase
VASPTEGTLRLATGITTGYTERGEPDGRPALLLLHAWAESRRSFAILGPLLPAWLRNVAIDLRGHGDADKPLSGHDLPTLAADVVAAMDALGMTDAVLVGASSGGYVAQQVAVDHPSRVTGLVLAGSPRDLRGTPPFADDVQRLADPVDEVWVRSFVAGFPHAPVPEWFLEQAVEDALRLPAGIWRVTLTGLSSSRPPTDLGEITAPTVVVSGAADGLLGREQTAALASAIPHSRWIEYPDAGHVVLWDQPERLAADIAAFLPTVAPSGP